MLDIIKQAIKDVLQGKRLSYYTVDRRKEVRKIS